MALAGRGAQTSELGRKSRGGGRFSEPCGERSNGRLGGGVGGAGFSGAAGSSEDVTAALEPEFTALAGGGQDLETDKGGIDAAEGNFEIEGAEMKGDDGAEPGDRFVERAKGLGRGGEEFGAFEKEFRRGRGEETERGGVVSESGRVVVEPRERAGAENERFGVGGGGGQGAVEVGASLGGLTAAERERAAGEVEAREVGSEFGGAEVVGLGESPFLVLRVELAAFEIEGGVGGSGGELRGDAPEGVLDFRMRAGGDRAEEREGKDSGARGRHVKERKGAGGVRQSQVAAAGYGAVKLWGVNPSETHGEGAR